MVVASGLSFDGVAPDPETQAQGTTSASLLARLQGDIRANREPDASFELDSDDRSIQIHSCYGTTRQVEVARDAVLHLLADESLGLSEEDVVVVCPTLDQYAPIIRGVFGASTEVSSGASSGGSSGGSNGGSSRLLAPSIRYRIADRSIGATNPMLQALSDVLAVLVGRAEADELITLLSSPPIRAQFGFDELSLGRIADWVRAANVRWGLDAEHVALFDLPASADLNTWSAALDRVLLGIAVDDLQRLTVGRVAPIGTDLEDAELAGRLAEFIGVLRQARAESGTERTAAQWIEWTRSLAGLLLAPAAGAAWQEDQLAEILDRIVEASTSPDGASATLLDFTDLRRMLERELGGMPGRPDFFRGGVTFTSMTPLRGIPFRAVVMLGLDQASLPSTTMDGDDLLAVEPRLGDPDPRTDARQALLDAFLVAQDRLVIVRTGHDVRTNSEVAPAVVVAELIDCLRATVREEDRMATGAQIQVDHPRQDFDPSCFDARPESGGPWSFDGAALAAAQARRTMSGPGLQPFLAEPLGPVDIDHISLDDLHAFLRHPVKTFLAGRLGLHLPRSETKVEPIVPVDLGGLERWDVGERLLQAQVNGRTVDEWALVESRSGSLPPGVLYERTMEQIEAQCEVILDCARANGLHEGLAAPFPVDVTLPSGIRVTGTVPLRLSAPQAGPCRITYSSHKAAHKAAAWLDLMALVACETDRPWTAVTVGRGETGRSGPKAKGVSYSVTPSEAQALGALEAMDLIVDLYRQALREPLPLFAKLSRTIYEEVGKDKRPKEESWHGFEFPQDGDDAYNALVFGEYELDDLLAIPVEPSDPPSSDASDSRAQTLAFALWETIAFSATARDIS